MIQPEITLWSMWKSRDWWPDLTALDADLVEALEVIDREYGGGRQ